MLTSHVTRPWRAMAFAQKSHGAISKHDERHPNLLVMA
jgi:hypothetical protein